MEKHEKEIRSVVKKKQLYKCFQMKKTTLPPNYNKNNKF
jgi:hypothetical protein